MFNHPAGSAILTVFDSQSYYSLQVYTGGRDSMSGANLLFFDLSVRWVPGADLEDVGAMASYRLFSVLPE